VVGCGLVPAVQQVKEAGVLAIIAMCVVSSRQAGWWSGLSGRLVAHMTITHDHHGDCASHPAVIALSFCCTCLVCFRTGGL